MFSDFVIFAIFIQDINPLAMLYFFEKLKNKREKNQVKRA